MIQPPALFRCGQRTPAARFQPVLPGISTLVSAPRGKGGTAPDRVRGPAGGCNPKGPIPYRARPSGPRAMTFRFGINGLGRIGRALLRLAHGRADVEVAAINDVVGVDVLARLLARDTIHGPFPGTVAAGDGVLVVGGREIPVFAEPEPAGVPWERAGVEAVVEATGRFARRDLAAAHLRGPVRRVGISAKAPDVDATFCFGINEES